MPNNKEFKKPRTETAFTKVAKVSTFESKKIFDLDFVVILLEPAT